MDRDEFTGYTVDGGYEGYMLADEAFLVRIPDSFSDERSYALKLSGAEKCLGISGFGRSAHIVLQLANDVGINVYVYVFTRSDRHRALSR